MDNMLESINQTLFEKLTSLEMNVICDVINAFLQLQARVSCLNKMDLSGFTWHHFRSNVMLKFTALGCDCETRQYIECSDDSSKTLDTVAVAS